MGKKKHPGLKRRLNRKYASHPNHDRKKSDDMDFTHPLLIHWTELPLGVLNGNITIFTLPPSTVDLIIADFGPIPTLVTLPDGSVSKSCNKCKQIKPIENFKPRKDTATGWHTCCNQCRREYAKEHSKKYKRNKNNE